MPGPELLVAHQTPELHALHVGLDVVAHGPPVLVDPVTHLAPERAVLSFFNVFVDFLFDLLRVFWVNHWNSFWVL